VTRILIVDDNPAVRRYLRAILEQQEAWKVCGEARTGAEALNQVLEARHFRNLAGNVDTIQIGHLIIEHDQVRSCFCTTRPIFR
jgi:CheY-like chemotaxis protein